MSATGESIGAGIYAGIVHIATGPDRLASVATLCGTTIRKRNGKGGESEAFLLGIKWGIGHSLGLLVASGTLIAMEDGEGMGSDIDTSLGTMFEWIVGAFVLGLGFYGLCTAFRNKREARNSVSAELEESFKFPASEGEEEMPTPSSVPKHRRKSSLISTQSSIIGRMEEILDCDIEDDENIDRLIMRAAGITPEELAKRDLDKDENADENEDEHKDGGFTKILKRSAGGLSDSFKRMIHSKKRPLSSSFKKMLASKERLSESFNKILSTNDMSQLSSVKQAAPESSVDAQLEGYHRQSLCFFRTTPGKLALAAGTIQGAAVATGGGLLGILPAVESRVAESATAVYSSVFCLASTLVMGGFAAFCGMFGRALAIGRGSGGDDGSYGTFLVEMGSACLSIGVGIAWMVLMFVGEMDGVFP